MAELSGNLLYAAFLLYLSAVFFWRLHQEQGFRPEEEEPLGVDRSVDHDHRICMPVWIFYCEMDRFRTRTGQQSFRIYNCFQHDARSGVHHHLLYLQAVCFGAVYTARCPAVNRICQHVSDRYHTADSVASKQLALYSCYDCSPRTGDSRHQLCRRRDLSTQACGSVTAWQKRSGSNLSCLCL